jgi:hypothetical protein
VLQNFDLRPKILEAASNTSAPTEANADGAVTVKPVTSWIGLIASAFTDTGLFPHP